MIYDLTSYVKNVSKLGFQRRSEALWRWISVIMRRSRYWMWSGHLRSAQYQVSHLEMTHADVNCRNVPTQSAGGLIADNCVHILTDGYLRHNPCFIITCLLHICDWNLRYVWTLYGPVYLDFIVVYMDHHWTSKARVRQFSLLLLTQQLTIFLFSRG